MHAHAEPAGTESPTLTSSHGDGGADGVGEGLGRGAWCATRAARGRERGSASFAAAIMPTTVRTLAIASVEMVRNALARRRKELAVTRPLCQDHAGCAGIPREPVSRRGRSPFDGGVPVTRLDASARRPSGWRTGRVPALMAAATVLLGVVDVVSAVTPEDTNRLSVLKQVVPLRVAHVASASAAVAGVLLILLGHGLRRRKRRAWRATIAILVLSTILHLLKGLDVEEASITLALAVTLVATGRNFYAAGDPRTRWRAPGVAVALLVASFAAGLALMATHGDRIAGRAPLAARLAEVAWGLIGVGGPVRFTSGSAQDLVSDVLLGLGAMTVLVPAYLALRAPEPTARLAPEDEQELRTLLATQGRRDSLGYFALRRDKSAIFSATRKAAISYRVVSGVMLASGDPIGDPEAWPGAIKAFVDEARRHAWVPAVIGCSELGGEVWAREAELDAIELGDEAIVYVDEFTLAGRAMRNVRQMVMRVERKGYKVQVCRVSDLTPAEQAEIAGRASDLRGAVVERGFSMALGRIADPSDPDCMVVIARKDDSLAALLHFVPWGPDGMSLDAMLRDRTTDAGVNELMIVAALRAAPELRICRVSLNFAVFRAALERGGRLGAGPFLRAWRAALLLASRWFQIESLYRFNAKFRPVWEPRFVCYPSVRDIPRVALAALEAEAFLVWPHQWLRLRRKAVIRGG